MLMLFHRSPLARAGHRAPPTPFRLLLTMKSKRKTLGASSSGDSQPAASGRARGASQPAVSSLAPSTSGTLGASSSGASQSAASGHARGASQPAVSSLALSASGSTRDAIEELMQAVRTMGRLPMEASSVDAAEGALAQRLRRARKADTLSREQEAELDKIYEADRLARNQVFMDKIRAFGKYPQ